MLRSFLNRKREALAESSKQALVHFQTTSAVTNINRKFYQQNLLQSVSIPLYCFYVLSKSKYVLMPNSHTFRLQSACMYKCVHVCICGWLFVLSVASICSTV